MIALPLVKSPEATEFFQMPNTLRKIMLGDPEKLDASVYNFVVRAHNAVGEGITTIVALTNDKTRNDVQRHAVAKTVAERVTAILNETKGQIEANARRLSREATDTINQSFAADPNRASIQSEIRGWIREQAKTAEGLAKIREAMTENAEVGSIIFHSPHFLLGLADSVRVSMMMDAVETHLPKAHAMLEASAALEKAAAKYPDAISKVRRSFFNPVLAEQASSRVEVG